MFTNTHIEASIPIRKKLCVKLIILLKQCTVYLNSIAAVQEVLTWKAHEKV